MYINNIMAFDGETRHLITSDRGLTIILAPKNAINVFEGETLLCGNIDLTVSNEKRKKGLANNNVVAKKIVQVPDNAVKMGG